MSEIERYTGGIMSRDSRRAARSIERSKSVTQVRNARVADEADVAMEKVEQVSHITATAMMAIARVNGVQKQLEQAAPELAGRLSRMADYHELAMVEVAEDLRRDLRRK